jgi:hypothetical protein
MKNRNTIILVVLLVLLSVAYYFGIVRKSKSSFDPDETAFAVKDTADILSVRMTYQVNGKAVRQLRLDRKDSAWTVNEKYPVLQPKMDIFLKTLKLVRAREPVLAQAKKNMLELMGREHTEIEIHQRNGKIKSYRVGTNTQDNMGTFMLLKGADDIYVTFIPGHKGYLNSRYSTLEEDWRENLVFAARPKDISMVSITYAGQDSSFILIRNGKNQAWQLNGKTASDQAGTYIEGFRKIIAESLVEKYYPELKAELVQKKPDVIFEIQHFNEKPFRLKIWYRPDRSDLYFALAVEPDAPLISLQEFHFGPYLRTRKELE